MHVGQRVVLVLGSVGVLHTSMVPPVSQEAAPTCRYAEFLERGLLFTSEYGVDRGDVSALISELGVVIAITAIAYLIVGGVLGRRTDEG